MTGDCLTAREKFPFAMQEFKAVLAGATRHKINQMQVPDSDDLLSLNGYIH